MSRLIGLGGRLRAGKDEVANHLARRHGFVVMGMSDPLLDAALVLNPVIPDYPAPGMSARLSQVVDDIGYVKAKTCPEVRRFLQVLGTDFGRNMVSEYLWVDMAQRMIGQHVKAGRDVVITGLRYPNEVSMIRQAGGVSAWIARDSQSSAEQAAHISENGVNPLDFDTAIRNDGSLEDLYDRVDFFLGAYLYLETGMEAA